MFYEVCFIPGPFIPDYSPKNHCHSGGPNVFFLDFVTLATTHTFAVEALLIVVLPELGFYPTQAFDLK